MTNTRKKVLLQVLARVTSAFHQIILQIPLVRISKASGYFHAKIIDNTAQL